MLGWEKRGLFTMSRAKRLIALPKGLKLLFFVQ